MKLIDWWIRYIVPYQGVVLDPFLGSGTTAIAVIKNNVQLRRHYIGIEKEAHYCDTARERIARVQEEAAQLEMGL